MSVSSTQSVMHRYFAATGAAEDLTPSLRITTRPGHSLEIALDFDLQGPLKRSKAPIGCRFQGDQR